ncbi:MAG: hypothetical protein MZW92_79580 [Comamonadaceae bacterium]|nr:hypothetical protein [Comamonadaceae bacterium]
MPRSCARSQLRLNSPVHGRQGRPNRPQEARAPPPGRCGGAGACSPPSCCRMVHGARAARRPVRISRCAFPVATSPFDQRLAAVAARGRSRLRRRCAKPSAECAAPGARAGGRRLPQPPAGKVPGRSRRPRPSPEGAGEGSRASRGQAGCSKAAAKPRLRRRATCAGGRRVPGDAQRRGPVRGAARRLLRSRQRAQSCRQG